MADIMVGPIGLKGATTILELSDTAMKCARDFENIRKTMRHVPKEVANLHATSRTFSSFLVLFDDVVKKVQKRMEPHDAQETDSYDRMINMARDVYTQCEAATRQLNVLRRKLRDVKSQCHKKLGERLRESIYWYLLRPRLASQTLHLSLTYSAVSAFQTCTSILDKVAELKRARENPEGLRVELKVLRRLLREQTEQCQDLKDQLTNHERNHSRMYARAYDEQVAEDYPGTGRRNDVFRTTQKIMATLTQEEKIISGKASRALREHRNRSERGSQLSADHVNPLRWGKTREQRTSSPHGKTKDRPAPEDLVGIVREFQNHGEVEDDEPVGDVRELAASERSEGAEKVQPLEIPQALRQLGGPARPELFKESEAATEYRVVEELEVPTERKGQLERCNVIGEHKVPQECQFSEKHEIAQEHELVKEESIEEGENPEERNGIMDRGIVDEHEAVDEEVVGVIEEGRNLENHELVEVIQESEDTGEPRDTEVIDDLEGHNSARRLKRPRGPVVHLLNDDGPPIVEFRTPRGSGSSLPVSHASQIKRYRSQRASISNPMEIWEGLTKKTPARTEEVEDKSREASKRDMGARSSPTVSATSSGRNQSEEDKPPSLRRVYRKSDMRDSVISSSSHDSSIHTRSSIYVEPIPDQQGGWRPVAPFDGSGRRLPPLKKNEYD
ncbi:hypothetical protein NA57DRAFT_82352 [Rhizodiscina lignyota]|uniref:Fungal N-terminal domain-containing protein n=1 Tax=Rhizodiscina lignyota TaxID=1504668 RepID=A0A9P4I5B9_9PEZI|nr:hypothetical protein NA57DRAFT_82352 [Rhizodiscina lignyota]